MAKIVNLKLVFEEDIPNEAVEKFATQAFIRYSPDVLEVHVQFMEVHGLLGTRLDFHSEVGNYSIVREN